MKISLRCEHEKEGFRMNSIKTGEVQKDMLSAFGYGTIRGNIINGSRY
ncbi:hypothetical protein [Niabella aquatica]